LSEPYQIFETDIFTEDLEVLQPSIRERIKSKLKNSVYAILKQQPRHGKNIKKLVNYNPETWRYRVGEFRIFYAINDKNKVIPMLTILARKDAY
jgi:mRNA interferase RelE/StbE